MYVPLGSDICHWSKPKRDFLEWNGSELEALNEKEIEALNEREIEPLNEREIEPANVMRARLS